MSDSTITFKIDQYENFACLDLTVDHFFPDADGSDTESVSVNWRMKVGKDLPQPVHTYRLEALSRLEGRLREVLANMTVR